MVINIRTRIIEPGKRMRYGVILTYPNTHNFGFDVYNPENWKLFLKNYRFKDGSQIPRKTEDGKKIYLDVYIWGGKFMFQGKQKTYLSLYNEYIKPKEDFGQPEKKHKHKPMGIKK